MTRPATSLVIVSRERPYWLQLCLTAVGQLRYPAFEVIVVADAAGRSAVARHPLGGAVKLIPFDEPNISAARNLGIAASAGEIVAFIDDDAVPEPLWLWHLNDAFSDPDVGAATGYTRGRDGVRYQSRAAMAHADGSTRPFDLSGEDPVVIAGRPGVGVKTEGTNMAFRRDLLIRMGGFDTGFRFYLDETDLNLRMGAERVEVAIVPLAEVHHYQAASDRRSAERTPRDLSEIGASLIRFLRRHCDPAQIEGLIADERASQRHHMLRAMVDGKLEPFDINKLIESFDRGISMGDRRCLCLPEPIIADPTADFCPLSAVSVAANGKVLAGRLWACRLWRSRASLAVDQGVGPVTLMLWSRTSFRQRVRFCDEGYWEHKGGLFDKRSANEHLGKWWRFANRVQKETNRIVKFRHSKLQ